MIANIYRPKRQRDGKTAISRNYRGRYRLDGDFVVTEVALKTSDKRVAEKKLQEIIKEKQMERDGIIAPKVQREAAQKSLPEHLEDFIADLEALNRSKVYVGHIRSRNSRVFTDCSWNLPIDISADGFVSWRSKQENLSPKTLNEYLNALNAFLN